MGANGAKPILTSNVLTFRMNHHPTLDRATRDKHAANLRRVRKQAGYKSSRAAALAMGVSVTTLYTHEKGKRSYVDSASNYAQFFGVRIEELLGKDDAEKAILNGQRSIIPYIDFSTLGKKSIEESLRQGAKDIQHALGCGLDCFVVSNPDRSMTGPGEHRRIMPGDILGFKPEKIARAGDYVLAQIEGMPEPIFRIFYPGKHGKATFTALNPNVAPIEASPSGRWKILAILQFIAFRASTIG